ncbi:MAG: glycosyltransferase family 39 protein [Deltaproteobacteria bacterium]|nr:glycosyltransferase family 39 protein [Deltaproteobacteria bacterium]
MTRKDSRKRNKSRKQKKQITRESMVRSASADYSDAANSDAGETVQSSMNMNKFELAVLCVILLVSLVLNLSNNNFPLGYHADEPEKVESIKTGYQDFRHPILTLQVVRVLNLALGIEDDQALVRLGRSTTAVFGVLIVLLSYLIFRPLLDRTYALVCAGAIAISPIMVVHAHYLKEDMILTCFSFLTLLILLKAIRTPNFKLMCLLGLSTGLAWSSHYKGFLLVPVLLAAPLLLLTPPKRTLDYYKAVPISLAIALCTFLIINYPLFTDFDTFIKGFLYEKRHVLAGHKVKIDALSTFFSFHLRYSLIPGITLLLTVLGLLGILYALFHWKRKTTWRERILILYFVVFYGAVELMPLKPFPGYIRYVIPAVPVIIYFVYKTIAVVDDFLKGTKFRFLTAVLITVTLLLPLYRSVRLVYYLNHDTRAEARKWIEDSFGRAKYEQYAAIRPHVSSITSLYVDRERAKGVTHLVASSMMYERYRIGSRLKGQKQIVYLIQRKYEYLFSHYPVEEFKPAYRTFSFSNPTIRIVDIIQPK